MCGHDTARDAERCAKAGSGGAQALASELGARGAAWQTQRSAWTVADARAAYTDDGSATREASKVMAWQGGVDSHSRAPSRG
mmetsp:Transcript_35757/g.78567  ORF Transcript_35757/g.78567 Transcript_35757/m.78567 type:complete len:82 (+) Transcript_35757:189-434(+)